MRYIPQTDERVDEPRMHADSDDTDHDPNEFGADPADILEHRELMDGVNLRGDVITGH